jgi:hypothetical protein
MSWGHCIAVALFGSIFWLVSSRDQLVMLERLTWWSVAVLVLALWAMVFP